MHADTTLHFDISSGIAGDMSLAVMHGLGFDLSELAGVISAMTGRKISITPVNVSINGITAVRLQIEMPHEHAHRKLGDIREMVSNAGLPEQVVKDTLGVFSIVAEAEGAVHGRPAEEVHFHEVGALDSILDITGFAYAKHKLGINSITSTKPVLGSGFVKCAHGKVPVPAPATLKILEGCEVIRTDEPNELTTPTGAAILKYYVKDFATAYTGKIISSAYSTGTLTLQTMPNILRGTLLENASGQEQITVIETNIDDCTGEMIGALFALLAPVSLDVFLTQTIGKKNRPSVQVSVLCENGMLADAAKILFANTSTAGLRHRRTDRIVMEREMITLNLDGTELKVKKLSYEGIEKYSPEWDDCVRVAEKMGTEPMKVYERVKAEIVRAAP